MKWRETNVYVTTTPRAPVPGDSVRWQRVHGYIARGCPLAVTASLINPNNWRVTHRPSGSAIATAATAEDAQRIVEEILPVGDWDRLATELAADHAFWRAASKALRKAAGNRQRKSRRKTMLVLDVKGKKVVSVPNPLARSA